MNSLFSCVQWMDDIEVSSTPPTDFTSTASVTELHEDINESDGMLQLTSDEIATLILDFHASKNLSAALSISSKCRDHRPAIAALMDLCRLSITNFETLGNEGKCVLLLELLRAHREVPRVVLAALGGVVCLMQSEMNTMRFLDNNISGDLAWMLQHYMWSPQSRDSAALPDSTFHRDQNVRLRVVGWCVQVIWLLARNETEGRLSLGAIPSVADDVCQLLEHLLDHLKEGDDQELVGSPSSGPHDDLFSVFLESRSSSPLAPSRANSDSVATPDHCTSLSDSLRRPANFFLVGCCEAVQHLCRGNEDLREKFSSRLGGLLQRASLPTRSSHFPDCSEESFEVLKSTKQTLSGDVAEGAREGATGKYRVDTERVVQV